MTTRIEKYAKRELIQFLDAMKAIGIRLDWITKERDKTTGITLYKIGYQSIKDWDEYLEDITQEEFEKRWGGVLKIFDRLYKSSECDKDTPLLAWDEPDGFYIARELTRKPSDDIDLQIKVTTECKKFYKYRFVQFRAIFTVKEDAPTRELTYMVKELEKIYCKEK